MIMPSLRVLSRPSRVRKLIFAITTLLRRFTNGFPFSLKKCITRSDCTRRWGTYPQMNLKPWSHRWITLCTPVHHSKSDCPNPGVQSSRLRALFIKSSVLPKSHLQDMLLGTPFSPRKKGPRFQCRGPSSWFGSGGKIWTCDLRVMSQTRLIPAFPFIVKDLPKCIKTLTKKYCIGHFGLFVVVLECHGNVMVTWFGWVLTLTHIETN